MFKASKFAGQYLLEKNFKKWLNFFIFLRVTHINILNEFSWSKNVEFEEDKYFLGKS